MFCPYHTLSNSQPHDDKRGSVVGGPVSSQHLRTGSSARATWSRASLVRALQRKMCRTTVNRSNTCTPQAASSSF